MRVSMYSPTRGYGFAQDEEDSTVFFAASAFERLQPGGPPPVLGELVEVVDVQPNNTKGHPKANRVVRCATPAILGGIVKRFDTKGGWGFVIGDDGTEYFLHRSDITGSSIPVPGGRAVFYPCRKKGKPRACHVTLSGTIPR